MKKTRIRKVAVCLVLLAAFALAAGHGVLAQENNQSQENPIDMFTYLSESKLDLEPYRGKAIFLNFFTEWCPYCMQEMPAIKSIFDTYSQDELQIVLVHVWDGEDARNTESIKQTYGLENMTFFEDETMDLARMIGIPGYPTSLFIGKDGYLATALPSALTLEQMARIVDGLSVAKAQPDGAEIPSTNP